MYIFAVVAANKNFLPRYYFPLSNFLVFPDPRGIIPYLCELLRRKALRKESFSISPISGTMLQKQVIGFNCILFATNHLFLHGRF